MLVFNCLDGLFFAAQGGDRLALPRHLVSQVRPMLLHPELSSRRLVPPHRCDSGVLRGREV
jgi:hypothetical protein